MVGTNGLDQIDGHALMMPTTPDELVAWSALLDLAERRRGGWTLVGGQMVHCLAWEHSEVSPRITLDADVVLDVRADQDALREVTARLIETGFTEDGVSPDGIGHRYRHTEKPQASIDVLIAGGLQAANYKTVTGARTMSAAGST